MTDVYYSQIDDVIGRAIDRGDDFDEFELTGGMIGDDAIITFGDTYRVLDKGLIFIEGTYCNYNEETGELEPDWSLTVLYKDVSDDAFDRNALIGFEQDPPETAIHNYIRFVEEQCRLLGIKYLSEAMAVHSYLKYLEEQDNERSEEIDEKEGTYLHEPYADAVCC